ncbi:MgtC/SapB family protein [Lacrimispora sp.]|uniref:MgtC/SapB family protein n=1 Tax=Lacrimispora sp. TaxID=2719234 RepID=UPI00346128FA
MDWIVMNYHHQAELLGRMILACFLGYLIGYERKNRDKSAGMRTHAIVSLGAALIMIVSKYGFMDIPDYDASRVAAQIVSGIGFLGAGIIFVKNNTVNGLTTAAGIWATAGVGMAVGAGAYFVGTSAGIMIVLTQVILHKTTFLTAEPVRGYLKMVVAEENEEVLDELQQQFCENKIKQIRMKINKEKSGIKLEFELIYPARYDKNVLITQWSKDSRVHMIVG